MKCFRCYEGMGRQRKSLVPDVRGHTDKTKGGKCSLCDNPFCSVPKQGNLICLCGTCDKPSINEGGACIFKAAVKGCASKHTSIAGWCWRCKDGYGLDYRNGSCWKCEDGKCV